MNLRPLDTSTTDDLTHLHTALFARIQKHTMQLQAVPNSESVAGWRKNGTQAFAYLRPNEEARTIESMMGRDLPIRQLDVRRHPVIELRATCSGAVLELVVPPDAWWDQQNLAGKLSIPRQRSAFQALLARLDERYRLGFWQGTHLDTMHLTAHEASHPAVFNAWMTTFCDGQDWFRIGVWYDAAALSKPDMSNDLFQRAQTLYELYQFIAWTGNNDFRSFYRRVGAPAYA
ncbi:MAG: hypothetical protein H7Y11_03740 [Armatimonadetes bacterium]|nr:hypothetical protein [Anaerolineae bacterium]